MIRYNKIFVYNNGKEGALMLGKIMDTIGISRDLNAIGVDGECAKLTLRATKDIRDKYVLSRLAWDLGILDELCDLLDS
jgi:hypothetical protein